MSVQTAIFLWGLLAVIGGIASFIGCCVSAYGLSVAVRRWILRDSLERYVARRDIVMLGSFTVASFLIVLVSGGLVWLSVNYPTDIYPVLQILALPVFFCYLGFALGASIFSTAGPTWVVFRFWALLDYQQRRKTMSEQTPLKVAEWCETDPKVLIKHKEGKHVAAHVFYYGLTSPEELAKIPAPEGEIDHNGDLEVHMPTFPFPWAFKMTVLWEHKAFSNLSYGSSVNPLAANAQFSCNVTLPGGTFDLYKSPA